MKRDIYILIKPASSACNMRCRYCFYNDVAAHRDMQFLGLMKEETVTALVTKTLAYANGGIVTYAFQGGEPLMAGEGFFRMFSDAVRQHNALQSPVRYNLQTNGTLLTDPLCQYLKENDYLVGISLDGPRNLHDAYRTDGDGNGSFDRVRQGISLLRKHGVTFNVLVVMTHLTAQYQSKLRMFFENYGLDDLQFITCLEPFGTEPFSSGLAMTNNDYFELNKALFDWYLERNRFGKRLSIRHLDNLINTLNGYPCEMCGALGHCTGQLVVEGNGNCYPCDFYCDDTHLLGNIHTESLEEMSSGPVMRQFIESSYHVEEACLGCPVATLCQGGCRRERDIHNHGVPERNIYCEGRKRFFEYVLRKLNIR